MVAKFKLGYLIRSKNGEALKVCLNIASWLNKNLSSASYDSLFNVSGLPKVDVSKFEKKASFDVWQEVH